MSYGANLDGNERPQAECRYRSGRKMVLDILDISLGGCMLDSRGWSVQPEEHITIKMPTLGYRSAKVVWIEDERAGVAFDEMLYEPTLVHIQEQMQQAA
ncbi:PilZ domain-containing protein [Altererythrobacter sp.]|uniref:PilZ domain-containing protein n=1 Tax=Altererythrobacter sp. TaxID=1872480 RepID=UPI003D07D42F